VTGASGRVGSGPSIVTGELHLTLPFAALIAVFAALIETSVLSELPFAGATVDLVLVCAAAATLVMGVEDGLVLAFVGGLLIDMVVPGRPLGAATLALLLTLALAIVVARTVGAARRLVAVGLVLVLTAVFHPLLASVLVLTAGAPFSIDPQVILISAVLNAIVAIPVVAAFSILERRFGATERVDW
jgi:rod shape-determining protein MreD